MTRADVADLLTAAETDWNRLVLYCPDWDQAELVRHTGSILAWMEAIVTFRQQVSRRTPVDLHGSLHLHATDGQLEWFVDLDNAGSATPGHRKGDTALRGTRPDLLLWLTNRRPPNLEVIGSQDVISRWSS